MKNLLKQIVNNTERKRSFSIVVSDNKTHFKTWFKPSIQIDKKKDYEIALINLETYYSFPNIYRSKNCFSYSPGANTPWLTLLFLKVVFTLKISMSLFNEKWEKKDHYDKVNDKNNVEISTNTNTLKSEMFLKSNYEDDFRIDKFINSLLGFHCILYTWGFHESEDMVNILTINSILVNIDIISGSYVNGCTQPTIYSFFPDVSPGIKLSKILIIFFTFQ